MHTAIAIIHPILKIFQFQLFFCHSISNMKTDCILDTVYDEVLYYYSLSGLSFP